jgi:integrase
VTGKLVRQRGVGLTRIDETKTAAGRRTVPLPSFAVAVLNDRRKRPYVGQQQTIFASSSGTLRDPDNFTTAWRTVRDELGMPEVTSHSFRKTVATLIDDAGLGTDRRRPSRARQGVDDPRPIHVPRTCPHSGRRPAGSHRDGHKR